MPRWRHSSVSYFGGFEFVMDEIQLGGAGKIADRENAAQRLFQARHIAGRWIGAQELFVAFALDFDQVRHLHHFVDIAEDLANALGRAASRSRNCLSRHRCFSASPLDSGREETQKAACPRQGNRSIKRLQETTNSNSFGTLRHCEPFPEDCGEVPHIGAAQGRVNRAGAISDIRFVHGLQRFAAIPSRFCGRLSKMLVAFPL